MTTLKELGVASLRERARAIWDMQKDRLPWDHIEDIACEYSDTEFENIDVEMESLLLSAFNRLIDDIRKHYRNEK